MANEKILVVDDEEHIAELINYNLTNNGYKVIIANNGIDAVKVAIEEKPSLILLDLMIPGKDRLLHNANKVDYLQQDATEGGKMTCFAIKTQKPRAGEAFIQEEWSCIR